jgi:hypothetical protein
MVIELWAVEAGIAIDGVIKNQLVRITELMESDHRLEF